MAIIAVRLSQEEETKAMSSAYSRFVKGNQLSIVNQPGRSKWYAA